MSIWVGHTQEGIKIKETDIEFHNIREKEFKIYGLCNPDKHYKRLEESFAKEISGGVLTHSANSSGGRVRFATDSPYIAVRIKHKAFGYGSPHITRFASLGVDLYVAKDGADIYRATYMPPLDKNDGYEGIKYLNDNSLKGITLFMPTGIEVCDMEVGVKKGSVICERKPYKYEKPVVFYGSSITNGYAASRPGNIYEGFVSRNLDCNFLNLGFSGCAMGEENLAEYISKLDMSAFVLDYDHNAPDDNHLKNTHERFFKIVREKNPDIPIIIITKPDDVFLSEANSKRRDVIMQTYLNARNSGDNNVYFIDGYTFFPYDCKNDCTVDGCHPNDLGMYFMARRITDVLKNVL